MGEDNKQKSDTRIKPIMITRIRIPATVEL